MGFSPKRIPNYEILFKAYGSMKDVLDKIIFIWNNQDVDPPQIPSTNVSIQLVISERNSLNNRFSIGKYVKTSSIISLDDDRIIDKTLMEKMLETHKLHPKSLIGPFGRSYINNNYRYDMKGSLLILTGVAMIPTTYLNLYTTNIHISDYVDSKMCCEDIAMNFLISNNGGDKIHLSGNVKDLPEPDALSRSTDSGTWTKKRSQCIVDLKKILFSPGNLITSKADEFTPIHPFNKQTDYWTRGWDNEAYHAATKYFWRKQNGIVFEMGALDGKKFSVSNDFIPLGWQRVIVEGTPEYWKDVEKLPATQYIKSAVCNLSNVHYLVNNGNDAENAVNGIAEFMSHSYLKRFYPDLYAQMKSGKEINWKAIKAQVIEVGCTKMSTIFKELNIDHVNFAVIDVEGAEMDVIKTIDFEVVFDVFCVETDVANRPNGFRERVITFLENKGYVHDDNIGRNSWFHHKSFTPITRPDN